MKGYRYATALGLPLALAALVGAAPPEQLAPAPRAVSVAARLQPAPKLEGAAAAPVLGGPKQAPYLIELNVSGVPKGTAVLWDVTYKVTTSGGATVYVEAADIQSRTIKSEQAFIFAGPKGQYKVRCRLVKGEDSADLFWTGELTAGVAPTPPAPDPKPPGPTPDPKPPEPATPNPFGAAPGLRVMVVTESADDSKLPVGQYLVVRGKLFRDYVDTNAKGKYLLGVDKDTKFSDEADMAPYKTAMGLKDRTKLPWLYAGKEAAGLSMPLPATPEETIKAIDKFLGK